MRIDTIPSKFFDFIFPPSEDLLIVRSLDEALIEMLYAERNVDGVIALSHYSNTHIRALIHEAKFQGNRKAVKLLHLLFKRFMETRPYDVIIPIPLGKKRMRDRGFNQITEIITSKEEKFPIKTHVMFRIRETKPQSDLKKEDRGTNVQNAFMVPSSELIKGKHILLVDDVMTTGSTLRESKAALMMHQPASVTCLALAH
jgi:ComF family protein